MFSYRGILYRRILLCLPIFAMNASAALPVPPQQTAAWTAPSAPGVPEYVVTVAGRLFEIGLADPRGGEYREVEVAALGPAKRTFSTHAWVFPGQFAVFWDGLVYRVDHVGSSADLDIDVSAISKTRPWRRTSFIDGPKPDPAPFFSDLYRGQLMAPAAISLLLRVGRGDLAAKVWSEPEESGFQASASAGSPFFHAAARETDEDHWLATSAMAWFESAYRRLVGAFSSGRYDETSDLAESILQWELKVPQPWFVENNWSPKGVPDLSFVKPVESIFEDARRRLHNPRPKVDFAAISQGKEGSEEFSHQGSAQRVAELLDHLDEVKGDKIAIPGPLVFLFDPIYKLLVKEGERAVDPLLRAYESDARLTPTFDYSRPWLNNHTPVTVHEVAGLILGDILGVKVSTPAELRDWISKHPGANRVERSFEVLADDQAGAEQWLASADFLTKPARSYWTNGGASISADICKPGANAPKVNGEELRERKNPSLSDLLAKRTHQLALAGDKTACNMAVKSALWNLPASASAVHEAEQLAPCRTDSLVTLARLSLGDESAASDWAAGVRERAMFAYDLDSLAAPIWFFPQNAVLQQAAESLFGRDSFLWPGARPEYVNSPLLTIPAYRRAVFTALNDSSVVGKATRSAEGLLSYSTPNGGGSSSNPEHDPRQVPLGQERPVRVKDLVALHLSWIGGVKFSPDWPDADKDAAITEIAAFLKAHANALQAVPNRLWATICGAGVSLKQ
jgi:hypothetical protein